MYILDTNALKGIGKRKLADAITARHDLVISPITFYELLCHLDEDEKEGGFVRTKGNVLKCKVPRILHDPFAGHAISVGAEKHAHPTRFDDPVMVSQLLDHIDKANTWEEFYSQTVTFPDSTKGSCRDAAKNVENMLKDKQNRYLSHINVINNELLKEYKKSNIASITPNDLADIIRGYIKSLTNMYEVEDGIKDSDLLLKVACSSWMHIGYKVARVIYYIDKAFKNPSPFSPDENDCEDAFIALHLELFRNDSLVTNDSGTQDALRKTIDSFLQLTENKLSVGARVIYRYKGRSSQRGRQPR